MFLTEPSFLIQKPCRGRSEDSHCPNGDNQKDVCVGVGVCVRISIPQNVISQIFICPISPHTLLPKIASYLTGHTVDLLIKYFISDCVFMKGFFSRHTVY